MPRSARSAALLVRQMRPSSRNRANAAQRFSLCAQTEEAPFYKYVSVEGPIVDVAPAEKKK